MEPEAETANSLVGIEVKAEVITALLPAQFEFRIDDVAIKFRIWINIHANAGTQDQRTCALLGDTYANCAQVDGLVKSEGTCALSVGNASSY